jgi:DNA polymerase-1
MARQRLFLIDSYGYIFRAYHARARSGAPPMRTAAGLPTEAVYIFHNMVRKLREAYKPAYMAAVFESGKTFREEKFADYKANRTEMPPDLAEQIPLVRRTLEAMRIPILEFPGFEADDVIGGIAAKASSQVDVVIVSSDKDMLQLVNGQVSMLNPAKDDAWYDPAKTEEFMGVKPSQVADLLALKGDSVDNIPGAPGIGDKGARDLIVRFGSVEAALDRAAEVEKKTYRESLQKNRDQILLSKHLATIDTSAPVEVNLEAWRVQEPDLDLLRAAYKEFEFFSLLKETGPTDDAHTREYSGLAGVEEVEAYFSSIPAGSLTGFALTAPQKGGLDLTSAGVSSRPGEGRSFPVEFLGAAKAFLEDPTREKAVHNTKALSTLLLEHGVELKGATEDVMLYAFLLTAEPGGCSPESLASRHLDRKLNPSPEQHADLALTLAPRLAGEVDAQLLRPVYEHIDLPLASVLARMERTGIRVETDRLAELSQRMDAGMEGLTAEIYALAGKPFNINSPQQLGKVLFEDLGLPSPVKYGKGKQISTAADVLEGLAAEHEIAGKVLEFRQLSKLKGTYVDALPLLIAPATGRVHTTFHQTGAATGRLSSSDPNLQNIPIRTELGREIRAAFVPEPGWKLIAADYSQIELRLLAHMSGDPELVEAFRSGEDIHSRTAAEVFGVMPGLVTPEMRRGAKAVNFGIVYGQTPFGLAQVLGIDRKEAERYIRAYFELHAGVKRFIDDTIAEVRGRGFATTLAGRRRPIPDMQSRNPNARSFAERTAVNTPLQGTAADLIKLAMIRIDHALRERKLRTRMLLQVHDELVFEAPPEECETVGDLLREKMEQVYELRVPLVVDIGIGENWRDAK